MQSASFEEAVDLILRQDSRYDREAYMFVREALDFAVRMLNKPAEGPGRHVTGSELLEGIRVFALQEFGPMAWRVLKTWGVTRTEDFGEIVFNLVDRNVLGKTGDDKREDFAAGYDFEEAFCKPFRPAAKVRRRRPKTRRCARGSRNAV